MTWSVKIGIRAIAPEEIALWLGLGLGLGLGLALGLEGNFPRGSFPRIIEIKSNTIFMYDTS